MNHDDPRLTAYLLGELPADERAAVEAALAADPALRAEVEALRGTIADLRCGLTGADAGAALTPEQRRQVQETACADAVAKTVAPRPFRRWPWAVVSAVAAGLLSAVMLPVAVQTWRPASAQVDADCPASAPISLQSMMEQGRFMAVGGGQRTETTAIPSLVLPPEESMPVVEASDITHLAMPMQDCTTEDPVAAAKPQGRGSAVSTTKMSGQGRFMAIGVAGGGAGAFGRASRRRDEVACRPGWRPEGEAAAVASTEAYDTITDNPFRLTAQPGNDASTFGVDVDTASYANVRRMLLAGQKPPAGAVRIEEMVNYFTYDYTAPSAEAGQPFAVHAEVAPCPWKAGNLLARVAIKGKVLNQAQRAAANLVFLIDVSGSMSDTNKLPLLKEAFKLLAGQLTGRDRVAMVVYAGSSGLVLPATEGSDRERIVGALDRLQAGGSTNGASGITLAYQVAREQFIAGGNNRVILATDGDFNVGVSDRSSLVKMVEENARSGVELTVLGFGMGNYKDATMQELSNKGNGNHYYIDSLREARKVLVDDLMGTLVTIAKDAKVQVFFNPAKVAGWRLIGYENRLLAREDFNDDRKDAGEIGAGHTVTAFYELVPAGGAVPGATSDPNPFVTPPAAGEAAVAGDALLRLRLRHKPPGGEVSSLQEFDVRQNRQRLDATTPDFRWAAAVAGFGMLLRGSPHAGDLTWAMVHDLAAGARGADAHGLRAEFLDLARRAERLCPVVEVTPLPPAPDLPDPGTRLAPIK